MNLHEVFIHIHQGCFAGTGAIVRLPQCQWSKPDGYGKISQCITTTKHSKAKTVCIFLGIYCKHWRSCSHTLSYGLDIFMNCFYFLILSIPCSGIFRSHSVKQNPSPIVCCALRTSIQFYWLDSVTDTQSRMHCILAPFDIYQSVLLDTWWRHQMETFSTLLAIYAGNSPVTGEFPAQRPVTQSFGVFFDRTPNKWLSKQSRGWWFETLWHPLCHHCNDVMYLSQCLN